MSPLCDGVRLALVTDEERLAGDLVSETRNPFALPRGLVGRVAGTLMARGNAAQQREIADVLDLASAARLLEIGFGPGELAAIVLDRRDELEYVGVDPSVVMRETAQRRNARAVADGRALFKIGAAAKLSFPDRHFDRVVAVNNVRIWPDIQAAAREVARVLNPDVGTAVISWHSKHSPRWVQRRLGLPDDELARIERQLGKAFPAVERVELHSSVAFVANIKS